MKLEHCRDMQEDFSNPLAYLYSESLKVILKRLSVISIVRGPHQLKAAPEEDSGDFRVI